MRVLFIVPHLPSPPYSGSRARMHGLISNISASHQVAVISFTEGRPSREHVEPTGRYSGLVVTVPNPRLGISQRTRRGQQIRSLIRPGGFDQWTYGIPSLQRALDRVVDTWHPDIIVVEFVHMGYVEFPARIPVVLDAHNIEHEIIQRTANIDGSAGRQIYSRINAFKLKREELDLVRRVDGLAVTSERDGREFSRLVPGVRPIVVPNGVDSRVFRPSPTVQERPEILFFGAMDYFPNVDAVMYFHDEIWPGLRRRFPKLRFTIIGKQPRSEVRALHGQPGITVTGVVEDVRDWINRATLVVVPLRAGSGTRLKVLEAMAMAKPIVSTSIGVEGLDVVSGAHLTIADMPEDFEASVAQLLESEADRVRLGQAARELVEERYEWRESARKLERLLSDLVKRSR